MKEDDKDEEYHWVKGLYLGLLSLTFGVVLHGPAPSFPRQPSSRFALAHAGSANTASQA
jgi:hypothetical protein